MTGFILIAALAISPAMLASPESQHFGTEYYDTVVRGQFQERVLVEWPGPSGLLTLWRSGSLNGGQQLSLLLGGAAFHDPLLLPVYREALLSKNFRLRQAAAYGYRDLIGDAPPNVRGGLSADLGASLAKELDAVAQTVRGASLVEMWLASMLAANDDQRSDWQGITFKRSPAQCLRAVERLAGPEDLQSVVQAYELSRDRGSRIGLMNVIEGLSMRQFIFRPKGPGKGWGAVIYDDAFNRLDDWLSRQCDLGVSVVEANAVADLGVRGLDLMSGGACDAWVQILLKGPAPTWAVAAERLYRCGGPAVRLSLTRPADQVNRDSRQRLKDWYGY